MTLIRSILITGLAFFGVWAGAIARSDAAQADDALGDPGRYHFFSVAPDTAGYTFLLLLSDISVVAQTPTGPIEVITVQAPSGPLNVFSFNLAQRETRFIVPSEIGCAGTICTVYIRGDDFNYSASLVIFGPNGGLAMPNPLVF